MNVFWLFICCSLSLANVISRWDGEAVSVPSKLQIQIFVLSVPKLQIQIFVLSVPKLQIPKICPICAPFPLWVHICA